jgi:hypothetical protein
MYVVVVVSGKLSNKRSSHIYINIYIYKRLICAVLLSDKAEERRGLKDRTHRGI